MPAKKKKDTHVTRDGHVSLARFRKHNATSNQGVAFLGMAWARLGVHKAKNAFSLDTAELLLCGYRDFESAVFAKSRILIASILTDKLEQCICGSYIAHKENGVCTRVEILYRLSLSYRIYSINRPLNKRRT